MRTTTPPSTAASGNPASIARRARLARTPAILLLAAALVLPVSGVMALDAPTVLPPEPNLATDPEPVPARSASPPAPPTTAPRAGDTDAARSSSAFTTGQQLDADDQAAFLAWVAAQQAAGQHRGVAIYSSW